LISFKRENRVYIDKLLIYNQYVADIQPITSADQSKESF
jgi:hypothetical protein